MAETLRQETIDNCNIALADMYKRTIDAMTLGFVIEDCTPMLYSILIHCVENIDIFNNEQANNIFNFINKINYGGRH